MAEPKEGVRHESDSDEKNGNVKNDTQLESQVPFHSDLPPDPDAHLSAEERAAIVSSHIASVFKARH
jgi:hypothetical protein